MALSLLVAIGKARLARYHNVPMNGARCGSSRPQTEPRAPGWRRASSGVVPDGRCQGRRRAAKAAIPQQLIGEARIGGVATARVRHDEDPGVADPLRLGAAHRRPGRRTAGTRCCRRTPRPPVGCARSARPAVAGLARTPPLTARQPGGWRGKRCWSTRAQTQAGARRRRRSRARARDPRRGAAARTGCRDRRSGDRRRPSAGSD